jgi:hypothetical protein
MFYFYLFIYVFFFFSLFLHYFFYSLYITIVLNNTSKDRHIITYDFMICDFYEYKINL